MIQPPPSGARPTLVQAALLAVFWPVGFAAGSVIQAAGMGLNLTGMVQGHAIVAAIMALPFVAQVLGRAAPGLVAPWGSGEDLFFRAARASTFLAGFVLLYQAVNWVLTRVPPAGWELGSVVSAASVLSWYGLLRIGPWAGKASGGGRG